MPTTTNFGWTTPADTDLVKDGALAIRTLANGIDTSFLDLKGGTTGQNLRKNTNTDLDFVWAGDATNTVIDAEGDLLVGDAADTLQRLAIGTTGQVLTVDTTIDGKVKWATASGNAMTLINTGGTTLSGSSTSISSIPSGYVYLYLELVNFKPATDDARFYIRPNNDSTANTYLNQEMGTAAGTAAFNDTTWTGTLGNDDTTATNYSAWNIYNYDDSTWKMITGFSMNNAATNPTTTISYRSLVGFYKGTSAITSLTFHLSTGNFTSGTVYLYGVK
jgi:hypothetical protein